MSTVSEAPATRPTRSGGRSRLRERLARVTGAQWSGWAGIALGLIAFFGIAVALLGRNTAIGVLFSALLFGGLITGTSVRNLDSDVFEPALATNLTYMIQGLVVLFVGAELLILGIWQARRRATKTAGRVE